MTEINSYKPLERAILAGEKEVKITTPKFLLACAVTEKCHANPSYTNRLIGLVMEEKRQRHYNPETTYTVLSDKGRPHKQHVLLSTIADALHVAKILDGLYVTISLHKNDDGHLTGMMDIVT